MICLFVEFGYKENDKWNRNIFIDENEIEKYRMKYKNRDVFTTYFRYPTPEKPDRDTKIIGDMIFDFDSKDDKEEARQDAVGVLGNLSNEFGINTDMVKIGFSGMKGYHVSIPFQMFGAEADSRMDKIYKRIAKVFYDGGYRTIDMKMYQKNRFIRLENSIHTGTGFFAIPLSFIELKNYDTNKIKSMALNQRRVVSLKPVVITRAKTLYDVNRDRIGEPIKISDGNGGKTVKELNDSYFLRNNKKQDFPMCMQGMMDEAVRTGELDHEQRLSLASFLIKVWGIGGTNEFFNSVFCDYNEQHTRYMLNYLSCRGYLVYGCEKIVEWGGYCKYKGEGVGCPFYPQISRWL